MLSAWPYRRKWGHGYQNSEASFICCLFWEQWPRPLVKYPSAISPPINNWLWGWWLLISELWLLTGAPLSTTALMGHLILITTLWSKNYNYFHLLPSIPTLRKFRPLGKIPSNHVDIADIYFASLFSGPQDTPCFQFLHNLPSFWATTAEVAKDILRIHTKFYSGVLKTEKGIFTGLEKNVNR